MHGKSGRHLRPGWVRRSLAESVVGKSRMSPLTPCGAPKQPSSRRSSALTALLESGFSWDAGRLLSGPILLPPLLVLLGCVRLACVSGLLPFAVVDACSIPGRHSSLSLRAACCPQACNQVHWMLPCVLNLSAAQVKLCKRQCGIT